MSKRIVVVDDDMEITQIIKSTLKTRGYEVLVAHNGQDGLRLIEETHPDMVILDLMLPLLSGMELIKRIRRDPVLKDMPVLVMSAISKTTQKPEEFWRRGLGADDFIAKPFEPLALLGRVEYVLRKKEYVSMSNNGAAAVKSAPTGEALKTATPKQVVKAFIESWNNQDFATEYNCLAEEMTGGLTQKEYIGRRRQFFLDDKGEHKKHYCEKILESTQSRNVAKVVCIRSEVKGHITRRTEESYVLRKTPQGWKIVAVRTRPITETKHDG